MSDLPEKDLPDEQQLDDYLRGGSDVSRQYRQLHGSTVPPELDRLVLRQAQEAVKSRPAKSRAWMRWTGPLALAASAVLVVSIVIESGVHKETKLTVPAAAPMYAPAEKATSGSKLEEDKATVAKDASDASVVHVLPVEPAPVADAIVEAPPAAFAIQESVPAPAAAPARERSLAIQPAAPPSPEPQLANAGVAANVEAPAPLSAPATAERRRASEEVVVTAQKRSESASQASVSSPVHLMDEIGSDDLSEIAVTGTRRPLPKQGVGPRGTITAPAHRDDDEQAAEQEEERQEQPRNYTDPEQWLRDIRELRKENKHEEADREWRRFRYVFPNYEVAEDDFARRARR